MNKIVLDTNVLLVSISERSSLHWVFTALLEKQYQLCVSTEILDEYAEILDRHLGHEASEAVLGVIENLPNVLKINTYYRFRLLSDEDDNKFVDCAIAANARFIVSHDKDFHPLKHIDFPKVEVIDVHRFKEVLAL